MSFKMMEGDFLGNQEEVGYVSTLMHAGLSLQDHAAICPDAWRAHTYIYRPQCRIID